MAKNRKTGTALAGPTRWVGGATVALVHLGFLLALLLTDHLTLHKTRDVRPMTIYRLPDDKPKPATVPLSIGAFSHLPVPSSVITPRLDGPMILIQPQSPVAHALRGFDLSTPELSGTKPLTQEDLMPSKEAKLKQFFKDQAEENRLAKEPPAGEDCQVVIGSQQKAASLPTAFNDPIPVYSVCQPTQSAKALAKRNDRFAPQ